MTDSDTIGTRAGHGASCPGPAAPPETRSVAELSVLLRTRGLRSTELVARCRSRIAAVDHRVNAVLALDPSADEQARESDARHAAGRSRGPLDGIPVLLKDTIDTAGLATSAGSRLLRDAPPVADAPLVTRLRAAGAIVLGKTNLSEWANFRSTSGSEGWSAMGGQTENPHAPGHSPWGSSAGSAAAVAAGMVPLAFGTETDGSLVCPAGACGVAALKPEPGALPLEGIVPVSTVQDAAGPMAARLGDVATALAVLGGLPVSTVPAPVSPAGLRLGRWRVRRMEPAAEAVLDRAEERLRAAGVSVVPVTLDLPVEMLVEGLRALYAEFRPSLEGYLRTRPGAPRTLEDLIAGNRADAAELALFGQDLFEQAAEVTPEQRALAPGRRRRARDLARTLLDDTRRQHGVDALVAATNGPAWPVDHRAGDPRVKSSCTPAALAGYPNASVPVGFSGGLPIGMSVFGPADTLSLLPVALAVESCCAEWRVAAADGF
ncbi:amidase family protein [Streptomyces sp. RKND-216]|uniref:amidase family protein n=1 Tax=Streptomyces sp. RKND-216 TaxID=2562581 RepID=UPI002491F39C|nr:amidase family protein [Streptomyces sp. RKND-216]